MIEPLKLSEEQQRQLDELTELQSYLKAEQVKLFSTFLLPAHLLESGVPTYAHANAQQLAFEARLGL